MFRHAFAPIGYHLQEQSDIAYSGSTVDVAESARQVYKTKMQALKGHNAVFLDSDPCCKPQQAKIQPLSYAKAQELRGNDIFAAIQPNSGILCNLRPYQDLDHIKTCEH